MYLLITPLGSAVFKWGGVSSILITGSVNSGYYEPLPLPSTIHGLLKYAYIVNNLGNDAPKFSGPLFYAEGSKKAICVHSYPRRLLCNVDGSEKMVSIGEGEFERRMGIALQREKKTTKEGYIYLEKMIDLRKLAGKVLGEHGEIKRYGVLVKVEEDGGGNVKQLNGFLAPFGGESRIAKIEVLENLDLQKINKKLLASPAIIDGGDSDHVEVNSEKVEIGEVKPSSANKDPGALKIVYRMLCLGFDGNKRLPMRLALMPTVEVKSQGPIGHFTDKGWGSVFEL